MQPVPPSSAPGSFVLLVLSVWGAVADNRYIAKGGKRPPKWSAAKLALTFVVLLVIIALCGASAESLGFLTGSFFLLGFAGYEAWRLYVRRSNPLPTWK